MRKRRKQPAGRHPQPRYLPQVRNAADLLAAGGGVHHVEVRHDDDCDLLHGRGPCTCQPTVHTGPAIDRKYRNRR